jgi:hypothetical protein
MANTPYLTIKPQDSHHDDVVITGTKESFEDLFGRLKKLLYLQDGSVVTDTMFNIDGEGFEVKLHIKPEESFKDSALKAKYYGEVCPNTGLGKQVGHLLNSPAVPARKTTKKKVAVNG